MTIQNWEKEKITKILALQLTRNKYGLMKVSTHTKEYGWSKHIDVLDIWENDYLWRLEKANNRTILESEIVLDFDPQEGMNNDEIKKEATNIARTLEEYGLIYKVYLTGSRGFHFHLIFHNLDFLSNKRRFRKWFIGKFDCDTLKVSEGTMIAMEHCPHWKTGNKKIEVKL